MKQVHAYRDIGPKLETQTRWSPRIIECRASGGKDDATGTRYVVKYRRTCESDAGMRARSAAMNISEVLGHAILKMHGFPTLEPGSVYVSEEFGKSYQNQVPYVVLEGYHFGTIEHDNLAPVDGLQPADFRDPLQWVTLWAIDSWVLNMDRSAYGNAMALPSGNRFDVVAVDQSDCFGGADMLAGGKCFRGVVEDRSPHFPCPFFEPLLLDCDGVVRLRKATDDIMQSASRLSALCSDVHDQWWEEAGVDPGELVGWLQSRASEIPSICRVNHWEGIRDATTGGHQIRIDL